MSKLRPLLSSDWEWVKLSPGSTYIANPRWRQANPQPDFTESVAAISDVDAEKTLGKSFDKTIIKKG